MNKQVLTLAVSFAAVLPTMSLAVTSGLKPGESVSPFHPTHVSGPLAGTTNCWPCTFQSRPQVQVWINGDSNTNVEALATALDKAMVAKKGKELKALLVFVTTSEKATELGQKVKMWVKNTPHIGAAVITKDNEAVSAYKINTSADIKNTVLVYKDWKVSSQFVNLKADSKGLASLNAAVGQITK